MSYLGPDPGDVIDESYERDLYVRSYEEEQDDYVFAEPCEEEFLAAERESEDDDEAEESCR